MELLSEEEGKIALELTRKAIMPVIMQKSEEFKSELELPPVFEEKIGGVIITDTVQDHPKKWFLLENSICSLKEGIFEAAKRAYRDGDVAINLFFPDAHDTNIVRLKIMILSVPKVLGCRPEERPENLVIGRDGIAIYLGPGRRGFFFMPQIATDEKLGPKEFLEKACADITIPSPSIIPDCDSVKITAFQVQTFTE